MIETVLKPRLTAVSAIGAPIVAILMFVVGLLLTGILVSLALFLFGTSELVMLIKGLITSAASMWIARRSTDVVFKVYSGRGVFIAFLVLSVILSMAVLVAQGTTVHRLSSLAVMLALIAFAYWGFWQRDQLLERSPYLEADDGEARGLHRLWEPLVPLISVLPTILFFLGGLIQLFAVSDQIHSVTHLPGFISTGAALFLTYIPILGSLIGFFGAKDVWGWEWWQAALLSFGPFVLMVGLSFLGSAVVGVAGLFTRRR